MKSLIMSCWVVPTVAAEIWGITVGEVLSRIQAGEVAVRHDSGWTFVDVAPTSPTLGPPLKRNAPRPETFMPISSEELSALSEDEIGEAEDSTFKDWRKARQRTSRLRLAPPKF